HSRPRRSLTPAPMDHFVQKITLFCFAASYVLALVLELAQLLSPRPLLRWAGLACGAAGLLAHTLFLLIQRPPVATPKGSLLLLAWVVAVFYLYGAVHHRKMAWAIFVLPLALGLVVLAGLFPPESSDTTPRWFTGDTFWGAVHGSLVL